MELLVVIAIIGILVALLLPAIQAAREAARRTQCTNNMKQLGVGLHNYHDTHKSFPFGWMVDLPTGNLGPGMNAQVWGVLLLPFIEQQPLFDRYDMRVPTLNEMVALFPAATVAANMEVIQTVVPTYICPSAPGDAEKRVYSGDFNPDLPVTFRAAPSDYCVASGVRSTYANLAYASYPVSSRDGALQYAGRSPYGTARASTMAAILDGTSNTILLGERLGGDKIYVGRQMRTATPYDLLGKANGGGWGDLLNGEHWLEGSVQGETAPAAGPCAINCTNRRGANFFGMHPGGAMFLLADASVTFFSDSIAPFQLASLITRAGGEPSSN